MSLTGEAGLSGGDIELDNGDGALDGWLLDVWRNRAIKAWAGDPSWPRADFRLVFDGIIDDVGSSSRETINLVLSDKLQRLNTPITEVKLGGTTPNKDAILPIAVALNDQAGRFNLTTPPYSAAITVSVQGDKGGGYQSVSHDSVCGHPAGGCRYTAGQGWRYG